MIFDFKINEKYVFLHAINMLQSNEPFEGWSEFTNNIWEKDPEIFYFLAGGPEYTLYSGNLSQISIKSFDYLEKLKDSKEFKRLIDETKNYKDFVEKQWINNEEFVLKQLYNIGVNVEIQDIIKVDLTHPKLKNGMAYSNNAIVWGHDEDYENYSTVYLIHELLHILTKNDNSNITHAIIELLADNEMRIRLNGKGNYFEYPGHKHLIQIEKNIYESWINYLKGNDLNIFKFINKQKRLADS